MISDFKSTCLIGSSGLIGENLKQNCEFDYLINSKNLETIKKLISIIKIESRGGNETQKLEKLINGTALINFE
jgi:hypothetical protein